MSYKVKEIFYSIQGEGYHTGRAAIFCRLSHCNLWTGKEADRDSAICKFCDTDFIGTDGQNGGKFKTEQELVAKLLSFWPSNSSIDPFLVLTGGEPLLQLDNKLIVCLKEHGFTIAIETNGTLKALPNIDWICVSPKANAPLLQTYGHELKLVYPQILNKPEQFANLDFKHFYLQPLDSYSVKRNEQNYKACYEYCLRNPQWKLSLQTHKILGVD